MECARMKELLSEYIDGTLDARIRATVDAHLLNCQDCRKELASLRALVRALESMEPVKAPEDFLEQLHDRMASPSIFAKIIKKLFVPIKIKVPLEFATAVAMAVLVIALVNVQQKERRPSEILIGSEQSKALKDSPVEYAADKTIAKENGKTSPRFKPAPVPTPAREKKPIELALLIEKRRPLARSVPRAVQEAEKAVVKEEERAGTAGMRAAPEKKAKASEPMEELADGRRTITEEGTLRVEADLSGRQFNETLSKVKNLIEDVDGKVMSTDYDAEPGRLPTIHAEIPIRNYRAFIDRVSDLAEPLTPPPTLLDKSDETIEILIRFEIAE
jgi:hypothetical protein